MPANPATIDEILKKSRLLKQRFDTLKYNTAKLEKELEETNRQLQEQQEINATLGEQIKMFKLAQRLTETGAAEKGELKRKLNEMIRSVDLCIAQLSEENGA